MSADVAKDELTRLDVNIFGVKYSMKAQKDATRVLNIVQVLNDAMNDVAKRQPKLAYKEVAVLAALNLAEQLMDIKEEYNELAELINE